MKVFLLTALVALALAVAAAPAGAATVTALPAWSPMVMFGLDVAWTDNANHALGGRVTVEGNLTSTSSPFTPSTARNLKLTGWPLEGGGTFNAGDTWGGILAPLNGMSVGRSFGWYASSDLPSGYVWKIVQTAGSAGFSVYDPYSTNFNLIFTSTGGSVTYNGNSSNWPGPDYVNGQPEYTAQMFHPVFAVPAQTGSVFAEYSIYLATTDGTVVANVQPAYEHLNFNATPEPASLALLALGGAALLRRRIHHRTPNTKEKQMTCPDTKTRRAFMLVPAALCLLALTAGAQASVVTPARGGGLDYAAPMIHVTLNYANGQMLTTVDSGTVTLKPLLPPDTFEAGKIWTTRLAAGAGEPSKAFNYQYGWVLDGAMVIPTGAAIYIRQTSATTGLECYWGRKDAGSWAPLFGTPGSTSDTWKLDFMGMPMAHNTYAVLNPDTSATYTATYDIFFGDATTGVPLEGYDWGTATLTFSATPEPATLALLATGLAGVLLRRRRS